MAASSLASSLSQARTWLRGAQRIALLTGAGVSAESGVPTFRDAQSGLWANFRPEELATEAAFRDHPERVWDWYAGRRDALKAVQPNAGHVAVAKFQARHPDRLTVITQNVDGLHSAAGSVNTVDLHGRIDTVRCMDCGHRFARADLQHELLARNPEWAQLYAAPAPDGDADLEGRDFSRFEVPNCPYCGTGLIKPDVVFYGESVPRERVQTCVDALARADALLIAGSSLMVYSGYRFAAAAREQGKSVVAINQGVTRADALLEFKVEADVGRTLMAMTDA